MRTTAILLAAVLLPLAAPAAAEPITVRVGYHDLDLRNAAHVDTLRQRVSQAVKDACRPEDSVDWRKQAERDCHRAAMKLAKREIERHRAHLALAGL